MNNEIIKTVNELVKILDQCLLGDEITLSINRMKQLLDYITNLQEKYDNSQITLAEEWKKRLEIEEKNKHLDNQITMLKQQNNAITEMGLDYKSKNKKAIEKLESIRAFGLRSGKTLFSTLINETIDILNGGELDER